MFNLYLIKLNKINVNNKLKFSYCSVTIIPTPRNLNIHEPGNAWFILQDFIPYMAEHYGFEYELVQYKWPRWLHQQTEKQRIIWG